jgi:predicted lactoylglutathione lyase
MSRQLFVNLPVKNLNKSIEFFTKLGFTFNPQFTDENATCMIINENCFVMLLVEPFFKTFITKEICDTSSSTEALLSFNVADRAAVDSTVETAIQAGANIKKDAMDLGFMYQRSFEDLDGHHWEVFYMDMSQAPPEMQNAG